MAQLIISAALFTAFTVYCVIHNKGMPWSLSKMHYVFGDWRFVVGTLLYGLPLLFAGPVLIRLSGVGIILVAAAPGGRGVGLEPILHVIGVWVAVIAGGLHLIMIAVTGGLIVPGLLIAASLGFMWYALAKRVPNRTSWIEIVYFGLFIGGAMLYHNVNYTI